MIETQEAVNNLDDILSVNKLNGVYIGPADMSLAYGLEPKFDVKDGPVFSNIKLIVKKAKDFKIKIINYNGFLKLNEKLCRSYWPKKAADILLNEYEENPNRTAIYYTNIIWSEPKISNRVL